MFIVTFGSVMFEACPHQGAVESRSASPLYSTGAGSIKIKEMEGSKDASLYCVDLYTTGIC